MIFIIIIGVVLEIIKFHCKSLMMIFLRIYKFMKLHKHDFSYEEKVFIVPPQKIVSLYLLFGKKKK